MKRSNRLSYATLSCLAATILVSSSALARDLYYTGNEQTIYVKPGEPTQVNFPDDIEGGFKRKNSSLALERQNNFLVLFAQPTLPPEGEGLIVHTEDQRSYALRIIPSSDEHPRDDFVKITDDRPAEREEVSEDASPETTNQPTGFAPPTIVSGLVREMILVSEFGKKKGITGYRRSNRYTGETVLHDGAIKATIDEIFMGSDLWGYVLSVENLLETNQKINPATFRLDGTRAVSAQNWELSPRPENAEQDLAAKHKGKVYIVTRAKR
ncbi:hypothetical protein JNK13_10380 [bacterium]|nr:hypothetical protein [bacterium]